MSSRSTHRNLYVMFMQVFTWIYVIMTCLFLFVPETLRSIINWDLTFFPSMIPMPAPVEGFWRVMSGAMVAMLALIARASAQDPDNQTYAIVHLASKLISTAGFTALLILERPMIGYAVGILSDFPIALALMAFLYTWPAGKKSRT